MTQRAGNVLQRILGRSGAYAQAQTTTLPWAGTFHSIGARLLREYAGRIGLDDSFTIHDRGDSEDLIGMVRHDIGLTGTEKRFPLKGTCLAIYSRVVNSRQPLDLVLQSTFPWCSEWEAQLKTLFGAYVDAKQEQNVLDYDDLLLFWSEMASDPELGPEIGGLFDHVLVDEYQDTNKLQAAIITGMKPDGQGVMVVGDDAQSIYSFRGATVRNILDFSSAVFATCMPDHAGPQLPLHAADPRCVERGHCRRARAPRQDAVDRQGLQRLAATGLDSR